MDFDEGAAARGAGDGVVEGDDWVLVVLEGGVGILLVDDALGRELLVVVGDLDGEDARVVDLVVGYNQLAVVVDVGRKFIRA